MIVSDLAAAFLNTTASYKHLFFRAILDEIAVGGGREISFETLGRRMLETAWWPVKRYRLFLGAQDQVAKILDQLDEDADEQLGRIDVKKLVSGDLTSRQARGILRYVPQRFLTPWLGAHLSHVPESRRDAEIIRLSQVASEDSGLPYRINKDRIVLTSAWHAYLSDNFPFISAWAELEWLKFLQVRNPSVPGISEKLGPPHRRKPLTRQTQFWELAASKSELTCPYTGESLAELQSNLDHFLPRSFVAHDRIWNLVPVHPKANALKGAKLPKPEQVDVIAVKHSDAIVIVSALNPRLGVSSAASTSPTFGFCREGMTERCLSRDIVGRCCLFWNWRAEWASELGHDRSFIRKQL
jgi:hypothetical protein